MKRNKVDKIQAKRSFLERLAARRGIQMLDLLCADSSVIRVGDVVKAGHGHFIRPAACSGCTGNTKECYIAKQGYIYTEEIKEPVPGLRFRYRHPAFVEAAKYNNKSRRR